jgi:hypothetical protein
VIDIDVDNLGSSTLGKHLFYWETLIAFGTAFSWTATRNLTGACSYFIQNVHKMFAMSVCNYSRVLLHSKDASLRASSARVTGSPSAKAVGVRIARTSGRKSVARFVTRSDMEADVEESLRDKKPKVVAAEREKFAVIGSGQHQCKACSYVYDQANGDPEYPLSPGTSWKVRAPHF